MRWALDRRLLFGVGAVLRIALIVVVVSPLSRPPLTTLLIRSRTGVPIRCLPPVPVAEVARAVLVGAKGMPDDVEKRTVPLGRILLDVAESPRSSR